MREGFIPFNPHPKTMGLIHLANEIIDQLATMGYSLTLRQLYYQLVARDVIRNKQTEYKRLGKIINEARLAGLVDWDAIEDRTRNLRGVTHYVDPTDVLGFAAGSFRLDKWANQEKRVEVWVEKHALVQVLEKACTPLDVDYFSCRGYTSQSEVYGASKRLLRYIEAGQTPVIIHLGDHDRWEKFTPWREANEVPMIIAEPGKAGGQVADQIVSLADIFPTVMDLSAQIRRDVEATREYFAARRRLEQEKATSPEPAGS